MKIIYYILSTIIVLTFPYKIRCMDFQNDSTITKTIQKDSIKCCFKGKRFIDLNGDGINDFAPDKDGDGIPNSLDPDFKPKLKNDAHHKKFDQQDSLRIKKRFMNKLRFRHRWRR